MSFLISCATCIPDRGSLVGIAQNNAIIIMLVILALVFGAFFAFIRYLMKCEKRSLQNFN